MFLRAYIAFVVMAALMSMVKMQINAADTDQYLTVEQLTTNGIHGLSFDRHYAMPIDFCIIPGVVALSILLCGMQWSVRDMFLSGGISWVSILICIFILWIGGTEAHVHDGRPTIAGLWHGLYAAIAIWTFIMVLGFTDNPNPVLLLILCIAVPAFLFVGQHMFLGMINFNGAASTFSGNPLYDPVGWGVLVSATGFVWWRSYMLIPTSFWEGLN